eukprot:PhM_4_TR9981/c0_g2_i1/m.67893/K14298/RAE1, GLE2; mRNA export factor
MYAKPYDNYDHVVRTLGDKPKLQNSDVAIPDQIFAMTSCLAWGNGPNPGQSLLSCGAWDGQLRIWNVETKFDNNGLATAVQTNPRTTFSAPNNAPILCTTFASEDGNVFFGGTCNTVQMYNLGGGGAAAAQQVAGHDQPVRSVAWVSDARMLFTGSWDGTFKVWDLRSSAPVASYATDQGNSPVVDMDFTTAPLGTILLARKILLFNVAERRIVEAVDPYSRCGHQLRCIANLKDRSGFACGTMDGRTMVHFFPNQNGLKTFSFRSNRENDGHDVFSTNAIVSHPQTSNLITGGSNGQLQFWDPLAKDHCAADHFVRYYPVSAMRLNDAGTLLASTLSYDWSMGEGYYNPQKPSAVIIKMISPDMVKRVPPAKK